MRVLILLAVVFLGCSNPDPTVYELTEKEIRQSDMITILNSTLGISGDKYHSIISNLCNMGEIEHSSHRLIINHRESRDRMGPNQDGPEHQEFRQNITDLQNRVYELENR